MNKETVTVRGLMMEYESAAAVFNVVLATISEGAGDKTENCLALEAVRSYINRLNAELREVLG